ncbi:MAG TPA: type II and III secretion system protein family protein [Pseudorhodoplanes sp.]|nr:type II and III secretion system protein family protein [Pseudorhodoplanes sp.]
MANRALFQAASFAALLVLAAGGADFAGAADKRAPGSDARTPVIEVAASEATSRPVSLGVGKSVVIDLPRDIKDVLVADPATANAVVRSSRRAYIIGVKVGQTNVFFFDNEGRQIAGFDIAVTRDLNSIRQAIRQVLPDADIRVEGLGDGVVLTGSAANQAEAQQAYDIATRLLGVGSNSTNAEGSKVVNAITVRGRDQVMIKVTVAEVQRDIIKQLGIDLSGSLGYGTAVVNFNTSNPFAAYGQPLSQNNSIGFGFKNITATLRAMDRAGVIRTLAEPSLTAISGESATFVAGGEFPVPNGLSCDTTKSPPVCQQQIDFKKFGIGLTFSPVVLSEGRISMKIMTEASDLSQDNAITIGTTGGNQTLTIPSIRTRRAETVVEIPSGGSIAMAGMIQEQTKQAINGLPGLMQLPILGALFKSRDYINRQTELMFLVTPYVVRAVAQKDLSRPDDGFADTSDPSAVLLGRLNRIYGTAQTADKTKPYHGNYGFILD